MRRSGSVQKRGVIACVAALCLAALLGACGVTEETAGAQGTPAAGWEDIPADTKENGETAAAEEESTVPGEVIETSAALEESPSRPADCILLGDSRTVGMYWAVSGDRSSETAMVLVNNSIVWDAKSGMGMDWMRKTGEPAMRPYVGSGTKIAVLMGVNDIGGTYSADDYVSWLNEKAVQWEKEGALVSYCLVNPVNEGMRPSAATLSNADIDAWNANMEAGLSDTIARIDLHTYLMDHWDSIVWHDWLHYESPTNLVLYEQLMQALEEQQ
ncbi:MAG: hypothetical protein PUE63_04745 [Lachnospiraceae bacterium]|nr:hypothetical protein [Lachnospiraceae bacterium]